MKINKLICIFIVMILSQLNIYSQIYDSSDLYFEEAKKNIAENNFAKAAKMSWRGLQISPNDLDLKILLGRSNLQLGKYDTARYVLKQVYERRRKDIDVLQYLVNLEETTKRYSDAICFVNELLEITPYSRGWWLKKINIYKEMGNFQEAERALKRLYQIYPNDTEIGRAYNDVMIGDGYEAIRNKKYDEANQIYKTIIDNNPSNKEAYQGIIANEMMKGSKENALQFTERALLELKDDLSLVEKKIGLLVELGRHGEAITYIRSLDRAKFPTVYSKTLPYVMQETAVFSQYNDSYTVYKKIAEEGGGGEAMDIVINTALGKGYYIDAEYFLKKVLSRNPDNKKYLIKQMQLYKAMLDTENYNKAVLNLHEKFPDDTDITYAYNKLMYDTAKDYILGKQYDKALPILNDLVSSPDFTKEAEQQIYSILLEQEKFDEATDQIDKLIELDPENPDYLVRKSTLYQKMQMFDDALTITRDLEAKYPLEKKYTDLYVSQVEEYATFLMREEKFQQVLPIVEDGLTRQNNNKTLLDIAINASSAIPDYQKGINYSLSALSFYPGNKNFKLKLSNMYTLNKDYDKSVAILDSLKKIYIYDRKIKDALAEVLFFKGKNFEDEGLADEAIKSYDSAYYLNPKDDGSLQRLINLYITNKPNEEALEFINKKLKKTPNDNFLRYKKGVVFELMKEYDSAYYYQKYRVIDNPYEKQEWNIALETLRAEQLRNIIGITYAKATSDSLPFSTSLAGLTFNRKYEKNTYGAVVNYAARRLGVGVQPGINFSRILNKTMYADVGVLVGTQFFPKFILYGNAYKEFKKGYDAQAGLRFSRLQDDTNFISLLLGGGRTWQDIVVSSKLNLMTDSDFFYFNLMAQTRINVNTRQDKVTVTISGGSAPFDNQLPEGQAVFLNFSNVSVGAGYHYNISPRTILAIDGTWTNFQSNTFSEGAFAFVNQYNLAFTIITKF
ncbi:tetratricopeptide repeat protein [Polaribacter gangjinensis]|nr:tetratricopeptide repeat protein [Polaribacter gangjinensis]